jgi:ribose transport system substrate-binding protein
MRKKLLALAALAAMSAFSLGAISVAAQDEQSFTIGISNSFVSSEWRTQMIQNFEETAAELSEDEALGVEIELVIESEDTDAAGQEQQIQNLINRGVDAIIVNPGDAEALRLPLEDAVAAGIVVISIDQEIDGEGITNVVIDQTEWATISMTWLAEMLAGEGDIVLIEGFVGHPANTARMNGVEAVLEANPGLNVVGRETGSWDQATGQQVMSDFLASLPEIDGVWTQDGMANGALTAIQTANPETWPLLSGEARASYIQEWYAIREENPDFKTIGVINPPGVASDGLRVAVNLLLGREIDPEQLGGAYGNSLIVPIPYVVLDQEWTYTNADGEEVVLPDNFDEIYEEVKDQPEAYTLDGELTAEEVEAYFLPAE